MNGYTQPSLNDIHKLIVTHGGGFLQYLDGKTTVTHIIASTLTPKKRIEFRRYRVVKPAWVVESIKAGKLLPWDGYRVVDEGQGQKVLGFDQGKVVSQVNERQRGYRDQTDDNWYTSQIKQTGRDSIDYAAENASLETRLSLSEEGDGLEEELPGQLSTLNQSDQGSISGLELLQEDDELEDQLACLVGSAPSSAPDDAREQSAKPSFSGGLPDIQDALLDNATESAKLSPRSADFSETESPHSEPNVVPAEELPVSIENCLKQVPSPDMTLPSKTAKMSAEEHNRLLLTDPHFRKSSAVNPDFIRQYYAESRLHHLSAWKADIKSQLQRMTAEAPSSQKAQWKRPPGARRYILHVDFDSFFAAVSLKGSPQYKDKPVVIAHGSGHGSEIASCNYPAREFGIRNGMWMKNALKLCPQLKVLPYDFKAYEQASKEFYEALLETGGIVQSVSVDEALVDVSAFCLAPGGNDVTGTQERSIWREQATAEEIARKLRDTVKDRTGCAVSVGIGGNILLAKVALRKAKPAGQYHIKPEDVLDYIGELTVQELPGVAHSIGGKLEELNVKLVKDVRSLSKERLVSVLGPKTGEKVWDYSRGIDRTEVGGQTVRKSVSAEVNWGIRFETQAQADDFVNNLCGELHKRLVEQKAKGKQLTMKIKRKAANAPLDPPKHLGHGKCDDFNRSIILGVATNAHDVLAKEALSMLKAFGFSPGELRGIGIQMTKLEPMKAAGDREGEAESSQRRLHFKLADSTRGGKANDEDTIVDDSKISKRSPSLHPAAMTVLSNQTVADQKPLNILGTQFAIPTQVDPRVLAELPPDIRSKLANSRSDLASKSASVASHGPRSNSPTLSSNVLPTRSQLDQETLAALPNDVKQEVLAAYQRGPSWAHGQGLFAQSPQRVRQLGPVSKKGTTPTKRRTGLLSRGGKANKAESNFTLTQSNFVAKPSGSERASNEAGDTEEISTSFLEALPEDIRREVLAQQKRERLKRQGNLNVGPANSSRTGRGGCHHPARGTEPVPHQRRLRLAPRPAKATFTNKKLSSLPELRETISAWVAEFADDGPYEEDVQALARYLGKIVSEERKELDKAVAVVKWLAWVKDDEKEVRGRGKVGWEKALENVKDAVQRAVKLRGLGPVEF